MLCDDFYVDAAWIVLGFVLISMAIVTKDMTLFSIASLLAGAGAYEMHQRFYSDVPHRS